MQETGLYKLGGFVLVGIVLVSLLAHVVVGDVDGDGEAFVAPSPAPAAGVAQAASNGVCTVQGAPRPLDDEIRETSGVAASRAHAGIAWTHNDSGDPVLFAVDGEGRTVGRVAVDGARLEDWEDLSLAPCPEGGDCLFVADIGDNDADHPSITVYRVAEPAPGDARSAPAVALRLRYPDGPHDAEAMFVRDGVIHVVTKGETGPIALYRAPADLAPGAEATLERVRVLSPEAVSRRSRITAADASADGRWIALRTLDEARLYPAAAFVGAGALPEPRVVDLRPLNERQGEGIGFTPDGGLVVTSERGGKEGTATLARLACALR